VTIPSEELTHDDVELIEFARSVIDANTDGEDGVHTMGAAVRAVDGKMYGGVNLHHFTTQAFDPTIFDDHDDAR